LRLAKFGVPIADTAAAGLAAAGIEPHLLPPIMPTAQQPALPAQQAQPVQQSLPQPVQQLQERAPAHVPATHESQWFATPERWGAEANTSADDADIGASSTNSRYPRTGQLESSVAVDRTTDSDDIPMAASTPGPIGQDVPDEGLMERDSHPVRIPDADVMEPSPPDLKGIGLVEFHYRALPEEQREMSANALAPLLAERTGYKIGTVRKYIGTIKQNAVE
ncbi:hypothetical protein J0695_08830, partial [Streptomyces beijiangensis]|nr:hypothetical protein [Streptomyces beijiangensis]